MAVGAFVPVTCFTCKLTGCKLAANRCQCAAGTCSSVSRSEVLKLAGLLVTCLDETAAHGDFDQPLANSQHHHQQHLICTAAGFFSHFRNASSGEPMPLRPSQRFSQAPHQCL